MSGEELGSRDVIANERQAELRDQVAKGQNGSKLPRLESGGATRDSGRLPLPRRRRIPSQWC